MIVISFLYLFLVDSACYVYLWFILLLLRDYKGAFIYVSPKIASGNRETQFSEPHQSSNFLLPKGHDQNTNIFLPGIALPFERRHG